MSISIRFVVLICWLILVLTTLVSFAGEPIVTDCNPIPPCGTVGNTVTAMIPITTVDTTFTHRFILRDATGTLISSATGPVSNTSFTAGYYAVIKYEPLAAGQLTLTVTAPTLDCQKAWSMQIESAKWIVESTMYYLSSSIVRDETWSVGDAIVRSSSAEYETLLWESFADDTGEINRHHVVVYDQATNINNYFQKGWHYWVLTASDAIGIMQRAVPDGDTSRYAIQE